MNTVQEIRPHILHDFVANKILKFHARPHMDTCDGLVIVKCYCGTKTDRFVTNVSDLIGQRAIHRRNDAVIWPSNYKMAISWLIGSSRPKSHQPNILA